ncbi:two-component system histidine kinase PnpS [Sulfobacillus harzensis]|uniref:Phosphate regulon sensor protein PhoR n=1 Tax=Sulfobacillus harzensis TaxID=2729629 RepID=A0A7Y0L2L2_9FIRM|nr:phosphate regulon sensor histidine kinase PhoR [Sulfobacillus harzensis]NMP22137.1 phosphate regulon sensor histidine kinase PhoR [Sulfobacillus harzensis]
MRTFGRANIVLVPAALALATVGLLLLRVPRGPLWAVLCFLVAWVWVIRYLLTWRQERRLLSESVVQLKDTVDRWASGDLQARVYLDQEDPLDSLAHGMNRVAEVLMERTRDLEEDKKQLEAILTSMANGIIILNHGLTITLINRAAREMFRIQEPTVSGRHLLEVIRDVRIDDAVHRVTRHGGSETVQWSPPDQPGLVVEATVAPLPETLGGQGAVIVSRDISLQSQLDRMRQDFVANVSHELQTPLTIIRGFTETLIDDQDIDEASRTRFTRLIHEEANRMSRLVDDLLTLSRMEHHSLPFSLEGVDVAMLAESVVSRMAPRAEEAGLALEARIPSVLPLVSGDPDRLQEVLLNLVQNAIQYTPQGGRVTVAAQSDAASGLVGISVKDTGIGIPAEDLPRIFERFYRVDKARSRASGGTGLGLAIVKHIIELHQGRIEVNSTVGQGTEFVVWLPQHRENGGTDGE